MNRQLSKINLPINAKPGFEASLLDSLRKQDNDIISQINSQVQGVGALHPQGRGFDTIIGPAFTLNLDGVACVQCGQCAAVCPVGAISEKSHVEAVWKALEDPKKNDMEYLNKRSFELNDLPDEELRKMHPDVKFYDEERKRMLHGEK